MRTSALTLSLLALLPVAGCEESEERFDTAWLEDASWEDGAAVVCSYRGTWTRYGMARDAQIQTYMIREYFDPESLVKTDSPDEASLRVLKANRLVSFNTGTYDYRLMASLFWHRETGRLVKAVATTQEGCGTSFKRYDAASEKLRYDTYWEGEARGATPLDLSRGGYLEDELPFVARALENGAVIDVWSTLLTSNMRGWAKRKLRVERDGRRVVLRDGDELAAEFRYDADGILEAWRIPARQDFRRVAKHRSYYWQRTKPGDEELIRPGGSG